MGWFFKIIKPDGQMTESGPYSEESGADEARTAYVEEYPGDTVHGVREEAADYQPLAPKVRVRKDDGSMDIYYNDGSIVNVS